MGWTWLHVCGAAVFSFALTGCISQAPYGTPESTAQLVRDLSLSESPEVVAPVEWLSSPYGISKPQSTLNGLFVSKTGGLRLVTFAEQRYQQAEELSKPTLQCGYIWKGEYSSELLHLFTNDRLYLLMIREKGQTQTDAEQRARVIQHLRANGIPLLTERDGGFFRATGKSVRRVTQVQGSWVSLPDDERETFNPCVH